MNSTLGWKKIYYILHILTNHDYINSILFLAIIGQLHKLAGLIGG